MKSLVTAILIGAGIEGTLVAALIGGGLGPCGPASSVGAFVLWLHAPGLSMMRALQIPNSIGISLVAATYTAVWSIAALLVLRRRF